MKNIIDIINEEISAFNKTKFYDVDDINILRRFYNRHFSEEANRKYLKYFIGKSGHKYLIQKTINQDIYKVYDMENPDLTTDPYLKPIAVATFDEHNDYFTGYEHQQSIYTEEKYRRDGIATAMIDFAETIIEKPYKPSNLLSHEMQGFIKNRFK